MKKLEKKEMKSVQGGWKYCFDSGSNSTTCVFHRDGESCVGAYTHGGDTIGIVCHKNGEVNVWA